MALSRKRAFVLAAAVLLIAGATLWLRAGKGNRAEGIRVWGNIEATSVEVSFKIPGRIVARFVSEGERVKAGQAVARLDDADLAHQAALREAELGAAKAALAELEAGTRPEEIAQARAETDRLRAQLAELQAGARPEELAAAQAAAEGAGSEAERARLAADRARIENERLQKLFEKDFVSASDRDNARAASDEAAAALGTAKSRLSEAEARLALLRAGTRSEDIAQAQAALARGEENLRLLRNGPRVETVEAARARVAAAEEALRLAQTQLGYAEAVSPLDGVCLTHAAEPGEYVNPGTPVVTVADLGNVWLRAYVDETDLGRVTQGMPVSVTADTYPGKVYAGRVTFIASEAEFTPRSVQTEKERVKLVYRVKIALSNPNFELKPGMPAEGVIAAAP